MSKVFQPADNENLLTEQPLFNHMSGHYQQVCYIEITWGILVETLEL